MDPILTEAHEMLRDAVRDFTRTHCPPAEVRRWDAEGKFPLHVYDALAADGYLGIGVDEEFGGSGGDIISQAVVYQELARAMQGSAQLWMNTSCFGAQSVGAYGTPEQKAKFLPAICEGKVHFAISITEPGGGTDVLGHMQTQARQVEGGWLVNGRKVFSTGVDYADYILLVTRSLPVDSVAKKSEGITVFLCPAKDPNVTLRLMPMLGYNTFHSYEVTYDNVFIPDELVLGEPHTGWRHLLHTLNNERILSACFSLGCAQAALDDAIAYAKVREAFGKPIGAFQAVAHHVANMAIAVDQARLLIHRAAWLQSKGQRCGMECTMAKCVAAEAASYCSDLGIQVLGGSGISMATDMQRYWRDSRVMRIGPVSNEMARNYIAMELGLPRNY